MSILLYFCFAKFSNIFTVCSHKFTLFWLRKISMIVKIFLINFCVFVSAFPQEISSFFGKSFSFPFPYFVFTVSVFLDPNGNSIFVLVCTTLDFVYPFLVCLLISYCSISPWSQKCLQAQFLYVLQSLFTAQSAGISRTSCNPSILCLWEEWKHGSKFSSFANSRWLKGIYLYVGKVTSGLAKWKKSRRLKLI